jgi:UDP-N-acetylmuramoyl-tripeptide--D-alanyl-D-alanine ligase
VKSDLDRVYLIGETFAKTNVSNKEVVLLKSFEEFTEHFKGHNLKDTTVLIKASRGMALERVLDYL